MESNPDGVRLSRQLLAGVLDMISVVIPVFSCKSRSQYDSLPNHPRDLPLLSRGPCIQPRLAEDLAQS